MNHPSFYNPNRVGQLYAANVTAAQEAGVADRNLVLGPDPSALLVLVDVQVDFVHTNGALSVPGAVEDTKRTIEWIIRNVGKIRTIAASLDTHVPISIFFPSWWEDKKGNHPGPYTEISSEDINRGVWSPIFEQDWSREYVAKLEVQAKKKLMIWPYHTLVGTVGHPLVPSLYEALAYHSAIHEVQPDFLTKGTIPETEYYSILEPEVKVPNSQYGGLNTDFLNLMADQQYDRIYVAGQAKSHCVLETINSMMRYFNNRPEVIRKFNFLMDCMSSVAHPVIDFEAIAQKEFAAFAAQGANLVYSTQDI